MNLCSDGHEEVCFELRVCPVCDLKSDYELQISELEKERDLLKDEIESLESEGEK